MSTRAHYVATVVAFTFAMAACARQGNESPPASETQRMTPAAGPAAPPARGCAQNFAAFDDDGDYRISQDEFSARPHTHADPVDVFRERDSDRDGNLTEGEFCSGWRAAPAGAGEGGGKAMGGRRGPGNMHGTRCEQHFDAFDADRDGKVTNEEFASWPHARGDAKVIFAERDLDHDGAITRAEFCSGWRGQRPPAAQ